ncbi:uncharacterized protein LOC131890502 [Tigriopus californicus]|uniref:uncharacterized protein LOC131890502 n=1 Tax=Tigriopus californicus TaxID=6832 RepID=UPI0027DA2C78|nr:uncharacterized protein LOC131890502 [Tigriopus californicus]
MELSGLPQEIHHAIFKHLGHEELENLALLHNSRIQQSLESMWVKTKVCGIWNYYSDNFWLTLHSMTGNLRRKQFHLGSTPNSHLIREYIPSPGRETKALEVIAQHKFRTMSGSNIDPLRTPPSLSVIFDPTNDGIPVKLTLNRIQGDPNEILLSRTHGHYLLLQSPTRLFFLDVKAQELLWHRRYIHHNNDGQALDFVVNDKGIFLTMKKTSTRGIFIIMVQFGFDNGDISALQAKQSLDFIFDSTDTGIIMNARRGRVRRRFYNCFQLEDVLSTWLDGDRLLVLVKVGHVYRVLSESLAEETQQAMRCEFIVTTDI